jgi:hypothetical protein
MLPQESPSLGVCSELSLPASIQVRSTRHKDKVPALRMIYNVGLEPTVDIVAQAEPCAKYGFVSRSSTQSMQLLAASISMLWLVLI